MGPFPHNEEVHPGGRERRVPHRGANGSPNSGSCGTTWLWLGQLELWPPADAPDALGHFERRCDGERQQGSRANLVR